MSWIENWLNNPEIKTTLGVDPEREFASCNMEVNQAFTANGDGAHNSAALLPELVNDGVRLLVYAGNAGKSSYAARSILRTDCAVTDMMCNFIVRV
jgi:cathepsin A (carboxypeptidase C)